jgi:hypothetical protein
MGLQHAVALTSGAVCVGATLAANVAALVRHRCSGGLGGTGEPD